MAEAPRPTRAEATDVANGVLDGADALFLGAETLRGNFASETVAMVRKICREAERFYDHESFYNAQISQRKLKPEKCRKRKLWRLRRFELERKSVQS